jgi:MFS family permease
VALGTISYNVARSFGPALGGLVVLAWGAKAAFSINAVSYIPLWIAFLFWSRRHVPSRLPPERIDRAIVSGARYALHSPPIRNVLVRAFLYGFCTAPISALAPLIAKTQLHGDAGTYGMLLGASGIGAVIGALQIAPLREKLGTELAVRLFSVLTGGFMILIGLSQSLPIVLACLMITGACSILSYSMLNVGVQLTAPRWVTARALSLYSSALTGGIAIGSGFWGSFVSQHGLTETFVVSGAAVVVSTLYSLVAKLPMGEGEGQDTVGLDNEVRAALDVNLRSGPVTIEVEYDVDPDQARDFYNIIRQMQKVRHRNGGFNWTVSRDIAAPNIWLERYHCPTWGDYLRMRTRYTQIDNDLQAAADAYNRNEQGTRVRRWLERPYGSVRWMSDSPDPKLGTVSYYGP